MKQFYFFILTVLLSANTYAQYISEGFESATAATDPSLGWIQNPAVTPGYGWFYDTPADFIINGTRSAVCYGSNDDWLISPGFSLSDGEEISISFNYRTNSVDPGETADISVYIGTVSSPNIANTGTLILQDAAINAPNSAAFNTTFTASGDNLYYIAFHAITDANESFTVDDVLIDTALSVNEFSKESISIFPNPASSEITVKDANVKQLDLFSILGQKVLTAKSNTIDVKSLKRGVYLLKIQLANGNTQTKKVILE